MPARTSRYGFSFDPRTIQGHEQSSARTEIFTPVGGLHRGVSPEDIPAGFTPVAYNFIADQGGIKPRSGLSQYKGGTTGLAAPALGAFRMVDTAANEYLIGPSARTLAVYNSATDAWSTLSYVRPSGWGADSSPSGTSRQYFQATSVYDAGYDNFLAVLTNNVDVPSAFTLRSNQTTFSNLTDFLSLASHARDVTTFDNRLVWWNVGTPTEEFVTRVMWSARGLPRNYQLLDGAGFEDLLDMRGEGTRVIVDKNGIVLFTDEQIWRGVSRRDAYVFDFYPIETEMGAPYANTIVSTPVGIIFLGIDLDLYIIEGDTVRPLIVDEEANRVKFFLDEEVLEPLRAWATYNPTNRRYELNYKATDSTDGFPNRALYYHVTERSFFPQRFGVELSAGVDFTDLGTPLIWDDTVSTWDDIATTWEEQVNAGSGIGSFAFTKAGVAERFLASATDDDGTAFGAQWTSHALGRDDPMRYDQLFEVFLNYKNASASSATVVFASDLDFSSTESFRIPLDSTTYGRAFIPGSITGVAPHMRIEVDGTSKAIFQRMQVKLVDAGQF